MTATIERRMRAHQSSATSLVGHGGPCADDHRSGPRRGHHPGPSPPPAIEHLIEAAKVLGEGDFSARSNRSGIGEMDEAAAALDATAMRLGAILERERAFSADASHQLRTPLTAMRVHLHELEQSADDPGAARVQLENDLNRLEQTIEDLLRLARDSAPQRDPIDLEALLQAIERRWHGPSPRQGGRLLVNGPGPAPTFTLLLPGPSD